MELHTLRVFRAVAQFGGITAAANRLHTVQSNVTAHIKKLEDETAADLFVRSRRGVELTNAGRILLRYANRILQLEAEAGVAIRGALGASCPIRLGSMESAVAVRLPNVIKKFVARFPDAEFDLETGHTEVLIESVLNRSLDCALIGEHVEHQDLEQFSVFNEELVLIRAKGHQKSNVLILFCKGCSYRARAEQWYREIGRMPIRVMEFGTLDGILGCVAVGLGEGVVPRSVATQKRWIDVFTIESLPPHISKVPTVLIRRRDSLMSDTLAGLLHLLKAKLLPY